MNKGLLLKVGLVCLGALLLSTKVSAQTYKDTLWVPVTFYDFHANGSNPEFEMNNDGKVHTGMVQNTLDADRKPILGPSPYFNNNINKWFRPWTSFNTTDTTFKNFVIQDSLPFIHTGRGVYQFSRRGITNEPEFFWIDNRGFGNDAQVIWNDYKGPWHNFSFTMELHWEFTMAPGLKFDFNGDDDVWAFVDGKLKMDLGGVHGAANNSFTLDNTGLVNGQKYKFDLFYAERHTNNSTIQITTNVISSPPTKILISAQPDTNVMIGDSVIAKATLNSDTGVVKDFTGKINWTWTESPIAGNPSTIMQVVNNQQVQFKPTKAWTTIQMIGEYADPVNNVYIRDTIFIKVLPGKPDHVYIEEDSTPDKWVPRKKDHITIGSGVNDAQAFAVLRDKGENFISMANQSTWVSAKPSVASVLGQAGKTWLGNITRTPPGTTTDSTLVTATDSRVPLAPGSAMVVLAQWYPTALKLVQKGTAIQITAINMNTDSTLDLEVLGQHSNDPTLWTPVDVTWKMVPDTLRSSPAWPTGTSSWTTYGPINPGSGTLNLKYANALTPQLNIPVVVTRSPPSKITISLITPDSGRIAGSPILTEIRIENKDGLVPGSYCYTFSENGEAKFWDSLSGAAGRPVDSVTTIQKSGPINNSKAGPATEPICFTNGIAQPSFSLHFAHFIPDSSTHQLSVQLGSLSASTPKFILYPGPLDSIAIENFNGTNPDPSVIAQNGSISVYSRGYDQFGNKIGDVRSNWGVSGGLHAISRGDNVYRIFYDAASAVVDESGMLRAVAVSNPAVADSIHVSVSGSGTPLSSAITRDFNGDGLLDAIELHFTSPLTWPAATAYNVNDTNNLLISYGRLTYKVSGVDGAGTKDSVFIVRLVQDSLAYPNDAQTDWTPYVAIQNLPGSKTYLPRTTVAVDGAGPVIWRITKTIDDATDRSRDRVRVTFSEKVFSNGNGIAATAKPQDLFYAYAWNALTATWDTLPILGGIENNKPLNDSTVEFLTSNGTDLTESNYLNIRTNVYKITDRKDPVPNNTMAANRIVQVKVLGNPLTNLQPVPNPTRPNSRHVPAGEFHAWNEPNAITWVRDDKSGSAMLFSVNRPSITAASQVIRISIKVYDVVGNLVNSAYEPDLLNSPGHAVTGSSSTIKISIYWNGFNINGMPCAPGIYRVVAYIDYEDPSLPDQPLRVNVGIAK